MTIAEKVSNNLRINSGDFNTKDDVCAPKRLATLQRLMDELKAEDEALEKLGISIGDMDELYFNTVNYADGKHGCAVCHGGYSVDKWRIEVNNGKPSIICNRCAPVLDSVRSNVKTYANVVAYINGSK